MKKKKGRSRRLATDSENALRPRAFPVVGIGASAGGLEAVRELFANIPLDTGMAFVFIQHLDPTHASSLPEILSRTTQLPVVETSHDLRLKPDHIFVIPPNKDIQVSRSTLRLFPRKRIGGLHLPIDTFLHSLAEDRKSAAIGVILSGTGSDGVMGLKAIKSGGGITFAQDSASAKYAAMPENAITAGAVDFVLTPKKIAAELAKLAHFAGQTPLPAAEPGHAVPPLDKEKPMKQILEFLRRETGVDFSNYNPHTIERRILRRMALNNVHTMALYAEQLRNNSSEINSLYEDIFIHVTNFFRDSDRFEILKSRIYPAILKNRRATEPIRIWCAGCSTGEEAYSLAMTLLEYLGSNERKIPIQIFATDISETAINKARTATYPTNIEAHVSPLRLKRFFVKQEGGYHISKQVREICVFTKHDVTHDPPFSRLDLISCSNVLIYFAPPTQKQILTTFHYALRPSGFLMLGKSESVGNLIHLFESLDNKHKLYARKKISRAGTAPSYKGAPPQSVPTTVRERPETVFDLQRQADRIVLARYGHRGLLVDGNMRILQFRGILGHLLAPGPGEATLNLTEMIHPDLRVPLRVLIHKAGRQNQAVNKKNIPVKINRLKSLVSLEVIPITNRFDQERSFLVLVEEDRPVAENKQAATGKAKSEDKRGDGRVKELQKQLGESREYLQLMIEQHEISNQKLDAANEELQSANEEMQSANEELETAKEELESSNEELNTLNEELQNRNYDLEQLNIRLAVTRDYAEAIIKTMREPYLVLDSTLKVQSANAAFYRAFHADQSETVNHYLFDLGNAEWDIPQLRRMLEDVLFKGVEFRDYEIEREFPGIGTRTLSLNALRITKEGGRAELILLAIGDITHLKQLEEARDVMIREVHHRVKNNLQVISSLLSLQAQFVHDKEALEMFKETANRIRSIAFIHEKLHQTDQPATVNFKAYASDLANSLYAFYGLEAKKIALTMDIADVSFHMDRAVPCGLILNELLTNAMKHAFPTGRKGDITVELREHPDGPGKKTRHYRLKVRDNGVGMPRAFLLGKTATLGMKIIQLLTKQIGGIVEMHRNHGTVFQITFPK